jgi:hypothetical protein
VQTLIESFPIKLPDGHELLGRLYQTQRRTGRRITVHETTGELLFDTDDCYDLGNARNALENWLIEQEAKRVADPSYTPHIAEALRHPKEFVDGMTEM